MFLQVSDVLKKFLWSTLFKIGQKHGFLNGTASIFQPANNIEYVSVGVFERDSMQFNV